MSLMKSVKALDAMITEGNFIEAIQKYFDENVTCFSDHQDQIQGIGVKLRSMHQFLDAVQNMDKIVLHGSQAEGNASLSQYSFHFTQHNGQPLEWHEVIRRKWKDGKVVEEQYFEGKSLEEMLDQVSTSPATSVSDMPESGTSVAGDEINVVQRVEKVIPDNDAKGLSSSIKVSPKGLVRDISLDIDIDHPFRGDLSVSLTGPSKETVLLHNRQGAGKDNLRASYNMEALEAFEGKKCNGKWTLKVVDNASRDQGTLNWWQLYILKTDIDDLKKIEGVGPKIEEILRGAGLFSYFEIANASASDIKAILAEAGNRYKRHDPTTWPQQARLAYQGKWDKLKELQKKLDGGRKK